MRLGSWLLALVPVLGLVELGLAQWNARRAPGFEDYARLAPELAKAKRPGEPIVVAPRWAEPLVRQTAGGALFPLAELARPDDAHARRFLEVSLLGASDPALAGYAVSERRRVGPFELRVRENPRAAPPLFDFVGAVERGEVEVFVAHGAEREPCPFVERARGAAGGLHGHVAYPRRRFECAAGRFVGVTVIDDQQYRPRRCVLAQPPEAGALVLRFAQVPPARVLGYAGLSYFLARDGAGGPVELSATHGARVLGRYSHRAEAGWARFELSGGDVADAAGALELAIESQAVSGSDFCFYAEAR